MIWKVNLSIWRTIVVELQISFTQIPHMLQLRGFDFRKVPTIVFVMHSLEQDCRNLCILFNFIFIQ